MPVSSGGVFLDFFCSAGLAAVPRKLMAAFYREKPKQNTKVTTVKREVTKKTGKLVFVTLICNFVTFVFALAFLYSSFDV
jgi:hypothetical protein